MHCPSSEADVYRQVGVSFNSGWLMAKKFYSNDREGLTMASGS